MMAPAWPENARHGKRQVAVLAPVGWMAEAIHANDAQAGTNLSFGAGHVPARYPWKIAARVFHPTV